jgi:dimethylhistidine N-methyltransferase
MFDAALVQDDIAAIALAGLTATPKTLPAKLFYDAEGVRLFEAITLLPEYYLTRTERAVLEEARAEIVGLAAEGSALIEYGASDEAKARMLFDTPARPFAVYVPIDVAGGALEAMAERLAGTHPWLHVAPVQGDFLRRLALPAIAADRPKFGFFPGSTIGNFDPDMAAAFLRQVREALGPQSWLIVGADIRKSPEILVPAYDDAQGVTAAFNLNILARLNREAAADFDLSAFRHRAVWNDAQSRMEMHLESLAAQEVRVGGQTIAFAAGETIHTENSYKHSLPAFEALARTAGWASLRVWTDPAGLFAVHALRAQA